MPLANVRGVNINYKVLGDHGPWVALSPGGRRDLGGVEPLAKGVADAGHRVVILTGAIAAHPKSSSMERIQSMKFGPMIFTTFLLNSKPFQSSSVAALPVAEPRCSLHCATPRPFAASCSGG